jgi:hypothetical protein
MTLNKISFQQTIYENQPISNLQSTKNIQKTIIKNPFVISPDVDFQNLKLQTKNKNVTPRLIKIKRQTQIQKATPPQTKEVKTPVILSPEQYQAKACVRDFILVKRAMFQTELGVEMKKEQIKRLSKIEQEEEAIINEKTKEIDNFEEQFQQFLNDDQRNTQELREATENKNQMRVDLTSQIKKISSDIYEMRSAITSYEEKKKEYQKYKDFLDELIPSEWKQSHEPNEMFFKEPSQLLNIMETLEQDNLFLLRNCQEAEQFVQSCKEQFNHLLDNKDLIVDQKRNKLNEKKKELDQSVCFHKSVITNAKFIYGNEIHTHEFQMLLKSIKEVHESLGYQSGPNIILMLTRIEESLERSIKFINSCDQNNIMDLAIQMDKQRREEERINNQELNQQKQTEKFLKSIEAANLPIGRKT